MKRLKVMNQTAFKTAAKSVGRAMGIQHSRALELLARAHGYRSFHEVLHEEVTSHQGVFALKSDLPVWVEQLRQVFGEASIGALPPDSAQKFFERICKPVEESPEGAEIRAFELALQSWRKKQHQLCPAAPVQVSYRKRRRLAAPIVVQQQAEPLQLGETQSDAEALESAEPAATDFATIWAKLRQNQERLGAELAIITQQLQTVNQQIALEKERQMRSDAINEVNALMAKYMISMSEL